MITTQMGCIRPMPCNPGVIGSLAFDGRSYALVDGRSSAVTRLDANLCQIACIDTDRTYSNLCYDVRERCFWASAVGSNATLYRLDTQFQQIGQLRLSGTCNLRPCAISCDPCDGSLWIAFPDTLARIDPATGACVGSTPCRGRSRMNQGLVALCDGYMVFYLKDGRQYLELVCPGCGECAELCIPGGYFLEAMILCDRRCDEACTQYELGLLLTKQGARELYGMQMMVYCCEHDRPPCPPPHPPCPPPHPPCPPPHPPCPHPPCPPPHPPVSPCCGAYEIIHSVALEEAGIAHILNAEGEKLQKAVAESTTMEELLCVNESVRRTITQITQLEGQLYSKLEVLLAHCAEPCDATPDPCHGSNAGSEL